jgi:hypothetical protein
MIDYDIGPCDWCHEIKTYQEYLSWTPAGRKEWFFTMICEPCFDRVTKEYDRSEYDCQVGNS